MPSEEIFTRRGEAWAFVDQVTKGVLKGTHTLKEAEAALEKAFEAENLLLSILNGPRHRPEVLSQQVARRMQELKLKHAELNSPEYKAKAAERARKRKANAATKAAAAMQELKLKHAKLNSPEYKAKAAERVKKRKANAAAKAAVEKKEREAFAAAKAKESEARATAMEKGRQAERRLQEAEAGVLQGTQTFEQLEEAARELFSFLYTEGRLPAKFFRPGFFEGPLSKLRWVIAQRRMQEVQKGVLAGTHSIEEAELAITAFYKLMNRSPLDEVRLDAKVAREMSGLQQKLQKIREKAGRRREEATRKRQAEREEANRRKLAAQAADEKLSGAKRAAAKAKLEEIDRKRMAQESMSRLNAAMKNHRTAVKEAEMIGWRALKANDLGRAERALEAEAEAWRELQESEREMIINDRVSQHLRRVKERVAWQKPLQR